jgi:transposase InsO family protein
MDVNRSGYYKWKIRKANPSKKELARQENIKLIKEVHISHPSHGYRWINAFIRRKYGVIQSNNHVHLCCKYEGIISQGKHYKYKPPGDEKKVYPNLVHHNWNGLTEPLEVIVSDMTAFWCQRKYYELTFYFDAFTKQILSYGLTTKRGDINQYYDGLNEILKKIKMKSSPSTTILHTDQGCTYSSKSFNELLEHYNIKRSMSRAGTPTDNPINESLNGWIKEELFLDFKLNKAKSIETTIKEYVHYYNDERPAFTLNYKTPNQYFIDLE